MIFPNLSLEAIVQVDDKTRFNARNSFVRDTETVTDVLIRPEASEAFYSVYNSDNDKWYLDWAYETEGIKTVTVKVITDGNPTGKEKDYTINVLTSEEDSLFSGDNDLLPWEHDILNYLPKGKNSFLYAHRKAQDIIIAYLDEQRIWNNDGTRISKEQIAAITDDEVRKQFKEWSTFQTLLIIFESIKVSNADVFDDKKEEYRALRNSARQRSALRLDLDKDETLDPLAYDIRTIRMFRR